MGIKHLFNAAGGLRYHWIAKQYHPYWGNFKKYLEESLLPAIPPTKKIVLVGPSGGYTFPLNKLDEYEEIVCIDPDPLAKHFFMKQVPDANIEWVDTDFFKNEALIKALFALYPDSMIVFCNFLGQWPLLIKKKSGIESLKQTLREELAVHSCWVSYHDRLSANVPFLIKGSRSSQLPLSNEELIKVYSPKSKKKIIVTDHMTQNIFPPGPRNYFVWPLQPKQFHIIEIAHSKTFGREL